MKEYIITIAAAAVTASLADLLAPKEWEKYIRLIIGFLILSVIIAPISKFKNAEILSPPISYEFDTSKVKDTVSRELEKNIEEDIKQRIKQEYKLDIEAEAEIETDSEHNITGVKAICVKTWKNPPGMTDRLKEIYGCEQVEIKFE